MDKLKLAMAEKLRKYQEEVSSPSPGTSGNIRMSPEAVECDLRMKKLQAQKEKEKLSPKNTNCEASEHDGDEDATLSEDEQINEAVIKEFLETKFGDWEAEQGVTTVPPLFVKDYKIANAFQAKLLDDTRTLLIRRREVQLFDHDELIDLWKRMEEKATSSDPFTGDRLLYYTEFKEFVDELEGHKNLKYLRKFLTPKLFLKLYTDDMAGRVSANSVFNYIMKRTWYQQTRIGLSIYDDGRGYIIEKNLESYIQELIPTLTRLNGMDPSFVHFYVGTAARKFLFFLDPYQTRKVKILDILSCGFIDDFLDLRDDTPPQDNNWFSYETSMRLYGNYLDLDKDHTGMLSKEEFKNYSYNDVTLTETFVNRIFQECQTFEGEIDYRTYLDFVLAVENKEEPASIMYFFRLLDIDHKGFLSGFDLHFFYRDIEQYVSQHSHQEVVKFSDIKDEIFDMAKPKDPMKITLQDLIECGNGHCIISILTDYHGLWKHELGQSTSSDNPNNSMLISQV